MRYIKKISALVAVAAALALPMATPAFGLPTAQNLTTIWLASQPSSTAPESCVYRRIQLAAGNYEWQQQSTDSNGTTDIMASRPIYLGAGFYDWSDCLVPNGAPEKYFYMHYTDLTPSEGSAATLSSEEGILVSGYFTWGSSLIPQ